MEEWLRLMLQGMSRSTLELVVRECQEIMKSRNELPDLTVEEMSLAKTSKIEAIKNYRNRIVNAGQPMNLSIARDVVENYLRTKSERFPDN